MRPLWRWTIGDVSRWGWEIFSESVRLAPKIYPEFDFVVCYNSLPEDRLEFLQQFPVSVFCQDNLRYSFHQCRKQRMDFTWKLVPPRMRMGSHELWVDNDIIIRERLFEVDRWLELNTGLLSSSPISHAFDSKYGCFLGKVDRTIKACAGFFGLPPYFDMESKVLELCGESALVDYDEQGMVVYIVTTNFTDWICVPPHELKMIGFWSGNAVHFETKMHKGAHFVGSNKRCEEEFWMPWLRYRSSITP